MKRPPEPWTQPAPHKPSSLLPCFFALFLACPLSRLRVSHHSPPRAARCAPPAQDPHVKYKFLRVLGTGHYGTTFLCSNLASGELVAIKALDKHHPEYERPLALQEITILAAVCEQPNIVMLYEVWEDGNYLYLVMVGDDASLMRWGGYVRACRTAVSHRVVRGLGRRSVPVTSRPRLSDCDTSKLRGALSSRPACSCLPHAWRGPCRKVVHVWWRRRRAWAASCSI
jgi:hypothetical protein